jgi:hypothetical protein
MDSKIGAHCTVEATVYRADGTVEHLGVICEGEAKPISKKSLLERLKGVLKNG